MRRTQRGDNILKFIEEYPGGILTMFNVEKMAGVSRGRLSHYKHNRKNGNLGHRTLSKLEKALEVYGFKANPMRDALMELLKQKESGIVDITVIDPDVFDRLADRGYINSLGVITRAGEKSLKAQ